MESNSIVAEQLFIGPSKPYMVPVADKHTDDERTSLLANEDAGKFGDVDRPDLRSTQQRCAYGSSFIRIYPAIYNPKASDDGRSHSLNADPVTGVLWGLSPLQQIYNLWFWLPQLFLTVYMLLINYEIATVYDQILFYTGSSETAEKLTNFSYCRCRLLA